MRKRYRFYACPEDECPKLSATKGKSCPTHYVEMVEVILRREGEHDAEDIANGAAKRVREAADKIGEARGQRPTGDLFKGVEDLSKNIDKAFGFDNRGGRKK